MTTSNSAPRDDAPRPLPYNWPLTELVGLAPLLAVSTSLARGLALGVITLIVLVVTNAFVALVTPLVVVRLRTALYVLVATVVVSCLDWLVHAGLYPLHAALGIFLPLIVANAGLQREAAAVASGLPVLTALVRGLRSGVGFLAALMTLGALRELVSSATLLSDIALLGGERATWLTIRLPANGALVAALPPGAFFAVAVLLAFHNHLRARHGHSRHNP